MSNTFTVPLRQGRRKTTLPAPPVMGGKFVAAMNQEIKDAYASLMRDHMRQSHVLFQKAFEPDPWDEAVRWIERQHEARQEWPWPTHD